MIAVIFLASGIAGMGVGALLAQMGATRRTRRTCRQVVNDHGWYERNPGRRPPFDPMATDHNEQEQR